MKVTSTLPACSKSPHSAFLWQGGRKPADGPCLGHGVTRERPARVLPAGRERGRPVPGAGAPTEINQAHEDAQ